ncbi:MAG: hypothetical protein AABX93_03650 [Nanoarchaeota archaeon]
MNEEKRNFLTYDGLWKLFDFKTEDFERVMITSRYIGDGTTYKISMFQTRYYFNANQFDKISASKGIDGLFEVFRELNRLNVFQKIVDNDSYFIFRRALDEADQEEMRIFEGEGKRRDFKANIIEFAPRYLRKRKQNNL